VLFPRDHFLIRNYINISNLDRGMQMMGYIKVQQRVGMYFSAYLASCIFSLICVAVTMAFMCEHTSRIPTSRAARVKICWHSNQLNSEKKQRGAQTASGVSLADVVSDVNLHDVVACALLLCQLQTATYST